MHLAAAIACLSASAVGLEILLVRFFAIIHWHHFAFMVISLALLGYGAGGTALFFLRARLARRFESAFFLTCLAFSISIPIACAAALAMPVNSLEIVWNPVQLLLLAVQYLILAVPFFLAGGAIGLALFVRRDRIGRLYMADLLGAGLGAAAIVPAMLALSATSSLRTVALLAVAATAAAVGKGPGFHRIGLPLFVAGALVVAFLPRDWTEPRPSEFKQQSQTLRVSGRQILAESFGPLGSLSAVSAGSTPFRFAPGLSLTSPGGPPDQIAVFTDGDGMTAVPNYRPGVTDLRYLDHTTGALPYRLLTRPRVLIIGAGGGSDVLRAVHNRAATVDALEANPQMAEMMAGPLAEFAGPVFSAPGMRLHVAEGRSFLAQSRDRYDLIELSLLDSLSAATGGMGALNASSLYTVEAMSLMLSRLTDNGMISISRWLRVPPRDSLKLIATAIEALNRSGIDDAASHIALVRGLMTATLIVKRARLTAVELSHIREFSRSRSFDLAYLPGLNRAEANRFNRLDEPYFFDGATALLGPSRHAYMDRYKFDLRPATDDRPFFHHFTTRRALDDLLSAGSAGLHLIEWGTPVAAATCAQAVLLGTILIVVPLAARKNARESLRSVSKAGFAAYFLCLGLGFLIVELSFIHRFIVFLGSPVHAMATVLAAFLIFAGIGSGLSPGLASRTGGRGRAIMASIAAIAVISVTYLVALPGILGTVASSPLAARVALTAALIAPLALAMGLPFPLALAETSDHAPDAIPWAWAINGCASVVGAAASPLIALQVGFSGSLIAAIALYGFAALLFRTPTAMFSRYPRPRGSRP